MKKAFFACLLIVCSLLFTGCARKEPEERPTIVQVDTESLYITTQGANTAVYDRVGGGEYRFKTHFTRRKDGNTAPMIAADTPSIKIELPGGSVIQVTDLAGRPVCYLDNASPW